TKIPNVVQDESWRASSQWYFHAFEVSAQHMVENERRSGILIRMFDLDPEHLQPANVTNKKSLRGSRSKHAGVWIVCLFLGQLAHGVVFAASALMKDRDVADLYVFDGMVRNSRENRADQRRGGALAGNVAQDHAAQPTHRNLFRSPH